MEITASTADVTIGCFGHCIKICWRATIIYKECKKVIFNQDQKRPCPSLYVMLGDSMGLGK